MNKNSNAVEISEMSIEEKAKELQRANARERYKKNRDAILKKRRLKRQENIQEEREKQRKYRASNPDKVKKWNEDYWKRKAEKELKKDA